MAPAYVKLYPPGSGGLIGEALGYLTAHKLDLARPPRAAVLEVPRDALVGLDAPPWIGQVSGRLWAWACERLNAQTLEHLVRIGEDEELLWQSILGTKEGAAIAGADEWLSNGDRNGGSLLRVSARRWAVIDYGDALGSHMWPIMGPNDSGETPMVRWANRNLAAERQKELHSGMINAHDRLLDSAILWHQLINDLLKLVGIVSHNDEVVPFLIDRCHEGWMANRLQFLV